MDIKEGEWQSDYFRKWRVKNKGRGSHLPVAVTLAFPCYFQDGRVYRQHGRKRNEKKLTSLERKWVICYESWKDKVFFFYSSCAAHRNKWSVLISCHLKAINGSSYTYVTPGVQIRWLFKTTAQLKGSRVYLESLKGGRMACILFQLEKNVLRHFYIICWKGDRLVLCLSLKKPIQIQFWESPLGKGKHRGG